MINDTTKEYNKKNTFKNNVLCNTWRLGGSWNLVTSNFVGGERGGKQQKKISGGLPYLGGIP